MATVSELLINYQWQGDDVSPVDKNLYVNNGTGKIRGFLLPDHRFIGISEEKNDDNQRQKSIFEGQIFLYPPEEGRLRLKKTYLKDFGDLTDYLYIAKPMGESVGGAIVYDGDVFGLEDSVELIPGRHFATVRLDIIVKEIH